MKLGDWLKTQRCQRGRGKPDAKKEKRSERLGAKWSAVRQEVAENALTGTLICCWLSRSKKGARGCQAKAEKVPLMILESGWGTNGLCAGAGLSSWIGKSGSRRLVSLGSAASAVDWCLASSFFSVKSASC